MKNIFIVLLLIITQTVFGQGVSIQSGSGGSHLDVPYLKSVGVKFLRVQLKPADRVKRTKSTAQTAFNVEIGWGLRIVDECNKVGIKTIVSFNDLTLNDSITDENSIFWTDSTYINNSLNYISKISRMFANKVYAAEFLAEPSITGALVESFYNRAIAAYRKYDTTAYFLLTPGPYALPTNYNKFVPYNISDNKLMYNFHFYLPFPYTHQGLNDRPRNINYPSDTFNSDTISKRMKTVYDWSVKYNYKVFLGEFNATRWSKNSDVYVNDVAFYAIEYGFEWCYFAYKPNYKFWNPYYEVANPNSSPYNYYLKNNGVDSQQWLLLQYYFNYEK